MPKDFGKNLAKSFKYGVVDTFLQNTAPDIAETLKSNKEDLQSLLDSGAVKGLTKKDVETMLKKQSTEIKKGFTDVRKNLISDLKSGKWFGNQERSSKSMQDSMFGDMGDLFGDDDFLNGLDFEEGTFTSSKNSKSGDIDFNFETKNETNVTDNRTNVNNITQIQNKVDGKLLASVTGQMVNSMSTISTQIKQISQFHLDETRRYYNDSLSLLTEINSTLKNVYTLQTPAGKKSVLDSIFIGNTINLKEYGKALSGSMMSGMLDKDNMEMLKMMGQTMIADPIKTALDFGMDSIIPKAIKKGMSELNNAFVDTTKTLIMQLAEGKKGKGTGLQKLLGGLLGLDLGSSAKVKFENKAVPFDSETKRAIVTTIPELLLRTNNTLANMGGTGGGGKSLRIDPETGLPTYEKLKKVRRFDNNFANKLVGDKYDYSNAGLSDKELAAQKEIDRLTKKIKELEDKKQGFWDVSQDKNIALAKKLLSKREDSLSKEAKKKISAAKTTRGEDYEEYSELLYKFATSLGKDRKYGISSNAIKTITAKEFDRRKAGGTVSDDSFDEALSKLSDDQKKVFANILKDVGANNKRNYTPNKNKGIGEIWSDSKLATIGDGKVGIKNFIKVFNQFSDTLAKQVFGNINRGLSNFMFGNEKGFKSNIGQKIGDWAKKNENGEGFKGWVAKKTSGFIKSREDAREKREREMARDQQRSRIAVEELLKEATSENCISVDLKRISTKAKEAFTDAQTAAAEKLGVDTEGKSGKDVRKSIKDVLTGKLKSKIIGNRDYDANDPIMKLLGLRIRDGIKEAFESSKTKKGGVINTISNDFVGYLKDNKFVEKWQEIGTTMIDEVRHMVRSTITLTAKLVKAYYKTIFSFAKGIFGFIGKLIPKGKTKSFAREMGERFMGVTNFFERRKEEVQTLQFRRLGGKLKDDGTMDFDSLNDDQIAQMKSQYKGLYNTARKQGASFISEDAKATTSAMGAVKDQVVGIRDDISSTVIPAMSDVANTIVNGFRDIINGKKKPSKVKAKSTSKGKVKTTIQGKPEGAYDADEAKQEREENEAKTAEQKTAEATGELVEQNKKSEGLRSSRFKKIISFVTMGMLLMQGGTKTVTTILKGVFGVVKIAAKAIKTTVKLLTVPMKILGGILKAPVIGKLITSGLLLTTLYTYLATKIQKGVRAVKSGVKSTISGIKTGIGNAKRVGSGIKGAISGVKSGKGILGKVVGGFSGFKSGFGSKTTATATSTGGLSLDPEKMTDDPVYQAKALIAQDMLKQHGLISDMEMQNAQANMASETATKQQLNKLDLKQKMDELKQRALGFLENLKKTKLYEKAKLLKDKAFDGIKRVIETTGSGIKGIGTAVQAIPIAGKVAAAAIGAAGLGAMIALVSKKLKDANSDKEISVSGDDGSGILAKLKKMGSNRKAKKEAKKAEKEAKKAAKLQEKKEKIEAVINSEEFSKFGLVKKAYWKYQAKKYGVSINADQTNQTAGAIAKLKAMNGIPVNDNSDQEKSKNSFGSNIAKLGKAALFMTNPLLAGAITAGKAISNVVSKEKHQLGEEKDGLIWNGGKWVSRALLPIGTRIGNLIWNGIALVTALKNTEEEDKQLWWQKLMSIGLTGNDLDFKTTKPNSLRSRLADFIKDFWGGIKGAIAKIFGKDESSNNGANGTNNNGNVVDYGTNGGGSGRTGKIPDGSTDIRDLIYDPIKVKAAMYGNVNSNNPLLQSQYSNFLPNNNVNPLMLASTYDSYNSNPFSANIGGTAADGSSMNYNNVSNDIGATVWKFFKDKGYSDEGIAGIMANLQAESGFKTTNLQDTYEGSLGYSDDSYTAAVDSGNYNNFIHDSAGYGLAQWTYHSLKKDLLDYAKSKGTSVGDLTTQLEFLDKSLKDEGVQNDLKNATSAEAAARLMMTRYERPADQSEAAQAKRASYATQHFSNYSGDKYLANVTAEPSVAAQDGAKDSQQNSLLKDAAGKLTIPPGATIYCNNSCQWGHVGISDGQGNVIHNSGGKVQTQTLEEFSRYFSGVSGWGWNGGTEPPDSTKAIIVDVAKNYQNYGVVREDGMCQGWVANVHTKANELAGTPTGHISAASALLACNEWGVNKVFPTGTTLAYGYPVSTTDKAGNTGLMDSAKATIAKPNQINNLGYTDTATGGNTNKNNTPATLANPKSDIYGTLNTNNNNNLLTDQYSNNTNPIALANQNTNNYTPSAVSTGYTNTTNAVSDYATTAGTTTAAVSSGNNYSEIIVKLSAISEILSNIANYDSKTASSIEQFLNESNNDTKTNNNGNMDFSKSIKANYNDTIVNNNNEAVFTGRVGNAKEILSNNSRLIAMGM